MSLISSAQLKSSTTLMTVIWVAFMGSAVVFYVTLYISLLEVADATIDSDRTLQYIFSGIGVFNILVLAPLVSKLALSFTGITSSPSPSPQGLIGNFFRSYLGGIVIRESGIVLAYVSAFSSNEMIWYQTIAIIYVLSMLQVRPRMIDLSEYLRSKGVIIS